MLVVCRCNQGTFGFIGRRIFNVHPGTNNPPLLDHLTRSASVKSRTVKCFVLHSETGVDSATTTNFFGSSKKMHRIGVIFKSSYLFVKLRFDYIMRFIAQNLISNKVSLFERKSKLVTRMVSAAND